MTQRDERVSIDRRGFLKASTLAGAVALAPATNVAAAPAPASAASSVPLPDIAAETLPPPPDPVIQSSGGADFMVDVLKSLNLEYCGLNPASTFRGIHESLINYGGNVKPELLTCTHEEIAVAIAHGYAKMDGNPLAVLCHGTVGLQHASMMLYNAFCDRVPVYMMIGNLMHADKRGSVVEWAHSAQDPAGMVRDYLKWDDQPASLQSFAESAVRAYRIATTPPMGPVLISLDTELQESPIPPGTKLHIPKLTQTVLPSGDAGAIEAVAKLLVGADFPVLIADRMARTQAGMDRLVELADTLQCAVIDQRGRTNFPSRHPLNQNLRASAVVSQADVIVGLELNDYWGAVNSFTDRIVRRSQSLLKPGAKTVSIGMRDMFLKSNYQDFNRLQEIDIAIVADAEQSLPALTEAVRRLMSTRDRSAVTERGKQLAEAQRSVFEQVKSDATIGWDSSPISMARICMELYEQIRHEDWSLVGNVVGGNRWPHLWDAKQRSCFNGNAGGFGLGYYAAAAVGAALANRKHGRLSVALQGDGDLMFVPGALWTAAHHNVPLLYIVQNNRGYHQEVMYVQSMAARRNRGIMNCHIGNSFTNPNIDFASVAKGFGVYAEGPISDPKVLGPALKRAIAVVKRGEPALLDVIAESR